jgi:hypothetical protein
LDGSFLQILAPELNDRLLADFIDMEITPCHQHIIRLTRRRLQNQQAQVTDLQKMKIEEQKKPFVPA